MNVEELREANQLANQLQATLERCKELWAELPRKEELEGLLNAASGLSHHLVGVKNIYAHEDFPSLEQLEDMSKEAGVLAESLKATKEQS